MHTGISRIENILEKVQVCVNYIFGFDCSQVKTCRGDGSSAEVMHQNLAFDAKSHPRTPAPTLSCQPYFSCKALFTSSLLISLVFFNYTSLYL
jgi:hypothetical protein